MTILYSIPGLRKFLLILQNLYFRLGPGRQLGKGARIFGIPVIAFAKGSEVRCGRALMLVSHSYFSGPGVNHPVVIRTLNAGAKLTIGNNVGISGGGSDCGEGSANWRQ